MLQMWFFLNSVFSKLFANQIIVVKSTLVALNKTFKKITDYILHYLNLQRKNKVIIQGSVKNCQIIFISFSKKTFRKMNFQQFIVDIRQLKCGSIFFVKFGSIYSLHQLLYFSFLLAMKCRLGQFWNSFFEREINWSYFCRA